MQSGNILIVDDEIKLRNLLRRIILLEGYKVFEAGHLKSAMKVLDQEEIDLVLCDVRLPDGNGIEFTKYVKSKAPSAEVIHLTAHGNIQDGVQAMRFGAFDYVTKGEDNGKLIPLIFHAMEKAHLQKRVEQLNKQVTHTFSFENIIGQSPIIQDTIELAKKVVSTNTTVLLLGETGTGKELFAKAIHANSPRSHFPFVAINCSTFSKDLLESELFGHKAGAFTGAIREKKGLIEEAKGGTLFLDEIGEMHIDLQAKLLRVLETSEFLKLGSSLPTQADVRVISATNKDLQTEVSEGRFREDLFYRLNVFSIQIPPLQARKKDIPLLARYFLKLFSEKMNKNIEGMSNEFLYILKHHSWKGNIRELKNVIERSVIMADGPHLTAENLPLDMRFIRPENSRSLSVFDLQTVEKKHIQRVLDYTKGDKTEAARLLNIGLTTVYRKMEAYHLQ
jgi:two-component system, NtrC family, response regulator